MRPNLTPFFLPDYPEKRIKILHSVVELSDLDYGVLFERNMPERQVKNLLGA